MSAQPATGYRRNYADDPGLENRVFALLETCFPGIGAQRLAAAQLGSSWSDGSTPFVVEENGQVVAHAGLLDMPYIVDGERHQLGGVHGVGTLASARRRGHFRRLMDDMLEFCQNRYQTLELSTDNPEYYEPFGFRVVPEYRFTTAVDIPAVVDGFRPFDAADRSDVALLDRLLQARAPVSRCVGVVEELGVFKFTQGADQLHYCAGLDCLAVMSLEENLLALYDVIAAELPSLDELLAQLSRPVDSVEFYFTPDQFAVNARAEEHRPDGSYYMVRGPFAAEGKAFMVPASARH